MTNQTRPDETMTGRPVTMRDVARQAHVSSAAASVVLSGTRSSARVSDDTRARILEAARDLRYTPNEVARALRRQRTDIIGLYLWHQSLDTHGQFMAEIVSGLQHGCDAHQKDLLIHGTFRGQSIEDIYGRLVSGKIDGLVLFAVPGDPLVERLAAAALPVITVADAVPPLPSVCAADFDGSAQLAAYLAGLGHRRVLYRRGPAGKTSLERRYAGFCHGAAERGMVVQDLSGLGFGAADGLSAAERALLAQPPSARPTAIACWNDDLADHTVADCLALGLRVPEDVAVVGFDGLTSKNRPSRRLTTIRAPWASVAQTAVDLLAQRLAGENISAETMLPVELIQGETA